MYRMYLDEVGTDDLSNLEKDNHRYLSLTGVIMDLNHVDLVLNPAMQMLKRTVFEFDPDEVIHLHRSDIVRRKSVFGQLNDNVKREQFDRLVYEMIHSVDFTVITVVIDKLAMSQQAHWQQRHPYHYLMAILVEKYVQFLERKNTIGDIMPEARQGMKDQRLQSEFDRVKERGTRYVEKDRLDAKIRSSKLKFRTKKDNISGLQLCDLIAHPSHMYVRMLQKHSVELGDFANRIIPILTNAKYDRSRAGNIHGYGIKYCP